jgi:coproporphyrinogen III oxidase-like Fe-S oxidoreductase
MGATSLINGVRETRPRRLADYYRYVNREKAMESVTDETVRYERLAARLMSRLRTVKGVDYGELHREFG